MSINICKECGKQFEAKSARIMYCPGPHYRPCPICGEPVLAKYLSDPPRRCDKCRGAKSSPAPRCQAPTGRGTIFKGCPVLGFIPGHEYHITCNWDGWAAYVIDADYDYTDDKPVLLQIRLSSKKSIANYFIVGESL